MREVDLKNYRIRTDLVSDLIDDTLFEKTYEENNIRVSRIKLDKDLAKSINKDKGSYSTIFFSDITDHTNYSNLLKVFVREFKEIISPYINNDSNILIVGLGNSKSTPDALGPKVIDVVKSTRYIYEIYGSLEEGFRLTSKIAPGVMGESGIETIDIIGGVISCVKPNLLIIVDALASSSIDRVCKTIQITDTGISPGSGVGNDRGVINFDTYNIPVIAIGIPTVVDASTIVLDTVNFMCKHFSYNLTNKDLSDKLIPSHMNNYLNKNIRELSSKEESFFLGAFGGLSDFEKKALINDVLTPIGYNLMVTPKEIDFDILNLGNLIGEGINLSLHNTLNDKL